MKKYLVPLLAAAVLTGCTARQAAHNHATSPADFVAVTLGAAAEQAHSDLAILAKLRGQGVQPILPPPDPTLERPLSVSWTGPADGILKEICLMVGYRYQEMGKPSAQLLPVVVNGLNKPAYTLLEDVAWQVQPQAVVRVDAVNRIVTLARSAEGGK
ncbi:MAG: DotD/TraH family lipoprotein [Desulfovibrio sp.]|nr:DotD/TraH family lipoprotein [Desulfovibrio sp.]